MARLVPAALALLALAAAGCGQSDDRDQVRQVTRAFLGAHEAGNGARACAQLSEDTVKTLESDEQAPCPRAVRRLQLDGGAVLRVQVYVTNAKVDLAGGESVFLSEESVGWRLSAVGCRPDGPPTRVPFDCELEA